jgi:hypothetical protein
MIGGFADRFRQPEYTGENRCMACTVVNSILSIVFGVATGGAVMAMTGSLPGAALAGSVVVAVSAASIYWRGYLIPGTPTITKRYFPPWLLSLFGKQPTPETATGFTGTTTDGDADATSAETTAPDDEQPDHGEGVADVDPEQVLRSLDVLELTPSGDDLQLAPSFQERLRSRIETVRDRETNRDAIVDLFDTEGEVRFEEYGDAFQLYVEDRRAGEWQSRAAFVADVAAAELFADGYPTWADLSTVQQGQLLNALRIFLESCPTCDGNLSFSEDTVESCCQTYQVYALSCDSCGARVFESGPM